MYQEYCAFIEELSNFLQVVYAYSDCSERLQMDSRLDEEARTCAVIARSYELITVVAFVLLGDDQALLPRYGEQRKEPELLAPHRLR